MQAKFLGWCRDHSLEPKQPSSLLNFLAYGHATLGWSFQTLANYRSSILDIFEDREATLSFWPLKKFFQAVQESTIRAERSRPVDIQPIIQHFHGLGPNHSMALLDLTTKLCWLLGVCGFMRPSDIERINLDESVCTNFSDKVILKVVAPKEKRLGQRIQKEIIIRQHDDPLLWPVAAMKSYLSRHAHHPCRFPHPALPHVSIHYLLRDIRDCHRPVYAQRISNHIKSVISLLPTTRQSGRIRARALGSTRALLAGASVDDVVTHGNWSNQNIYNTFYRLSTETHSNFTSFVLGTSRSNSNTLEQQSQDP